MNGRVVSTPPPGSPRSLRLFSPAPASAGLKLKWADGWIEDFPEHEFAEECQDRPRKIKMYKRGQRPVAIEYSLTVHGRDALLDYGGAFEARNGAPDRDIYIGVTRIRFVDSHRVAVASIAWRDAEVRRGQKRGFIEYDVSVSWHRPTRRFPVGPFRVPSDGARPMRAEALAVLRPGQLRFRAELLHAFESQCCVTGCRIPSALEAAHIIAFRVSAFDDPRNGLLVRADLHRLFDELLWSVDPRTLRVVTAPELRQVREYANLDGRPLLLPKDGRRRPARAALEDHWRRFVASNRSHVRRKIKHSLPAS